MRKKTWEEVWREEFGDVRTVAEEYWDMLWNEAQELQINYELDHQRPEILARAWVFRWGLRVLRSLVWGDEKEKREKYLMAQAAKYVYAIRHLDTAGENPTYTEYLWWCEELFPITQRYCEYTEYTEKEAQ